MPFIVRPSCCRSTRASRTDPAGAFPRFDMLGALERCAHLLVRFGGHRQAAGLTMEAARIRELRSQVNDVADDTLGPEDLMPRLRIDGDLAFKGITGGVAAGGCSAGAVRRREPAAGVRRTRRRDHRRPEKAQGTPPEDGPQAGRPDIPRDRLARQPNATTISPSTRPRSTSPSRWSRTSTMGRRTSSLPSRT